jgi:hypothetical protein
MRTITVEWLREHHACEERVAVVEQEWGAGEIPLTRDNLLRAAKLMLDLEWLAEGLDLSAESQRVYYETTAESQRVYYETTAESLRVYKGAIAEALFRALQEDER